MVTETGSLGEKLRLLVTPAVPFLVQSTVSAGTFAAGLYAAQIAGCLTRVSCTSPIVGNVCGAFGVALASAAAGQASYQCQRYYRGMPPNLLWNISSKQDFVIDAIVGMAMWKILGRRFNSVMPSNLFGPGAMAVGSVPCKSAKYAGENIREELRNLYKRYGCHHCGTRGGRAIGDHIPPNRMVWENSRPSRISASLEKLALKKGYRSRRPAGLKEAVRLNFEKYFRMASEALSGQIPKQRFYPQCLACCKKQAIAVRQGRKTLVMHSGALRSSSLAGTLVGLRYHTGRPPPSSDNQGSGQKRSSTAVDAFGLRWHRIPKTLIDKFGDLVTEAGVRLSLRPHPLHQGTCTSSAIQLLIIG